MSPTYFADTSFWLALLRPRDQQYARAAGWQQHVARHGVDLVTTEAVMWEMLNSLAGPKARGAALTLYQRLHKAAGLEIVGFDPRLCAAAVDLYAARPDKGWGVVDCLSFAVMRERGLTESLSFDNQFEQAGFIALLLHDPPA